MKEKVNTFAKAMMNELQANKEKGKWDSLHPLYLCAELHYHVSKLYKACNEGDKQNILEYSADCGNLAMMIADVTESMNHSDTQCGDSINCSDTMQDLILYYMKSNHDFNTPISEVVSDMIQDKNKTNGYNI